MDARAWRAVLPDVICLGDVTRDGVVDVFDLLSYLKLWFAGNHRAQRDGDERHRIELADLLKFLDDWYAGC